MGGPGNEARYRLLIHSFIHELLLQKKIISSCIVDDTYGTVMYMMLLLGVGCGHVRKTEPAWPIILSKPQDQINFGLMVSTVSAVVKALVHAFVLVT